MSMAKRVKMTVTAAVLTASMGCVDLDVTNVNEPDRGRALASASDVEALISGTFRTWWELQQGQAPGPAMASLADDVSQSQANYGFQDQGQEPPTPIINETAYQWGYWVYDPWTFTNRALASLRDGLQSIDDLGLEMGVGNQDGPRVQTFARFMQGLLLGNIALQYDQGFILDETVEDPEALELVPYQDVMAAAREKLATAREMATDNSFTIPGGWMGPSSYTSDDLVRLTHSYEARFMAQVARTPADREQVLWAEVLAHINSGVLDDFGIELAGNDDVWSVNGGMKDQQGDGSNVDLALIGPADQSGAYAAWEAASPGSKLAFLVDTDDRRITDGTPEGPGAYTTWRNSLGAPAERGLYFQSNYARKWYLGISETGFGFAPELTVEEMGFLAAEAHIRMGNPDLALPFINGDRVAVGQLDAATVDGAPGARCVPRATGLLARASDTPEGECGDLMQTLIYESRIELAFLTAGNSWYNSRGWGTLRPGRAYHCPIPSVDLELLGMPIYTFGGVGGEGSAS